MRLDVQSENRLGITNEILAVFAQHHIDVRAIDMVTNHTFIDAPRVTKKTFGALQSGLLGIVGVSAVIPVDLLPSEEKTEQLLSVLSALDEPVIAVSDEGEIVLANDAAAILFSASKSKNLIGTKLGEFLPGSIFETARNQGFNLAEQEVITDKGAFILHAVPVQLDTLAGVRRIGGVIVLQPMEKMGRVITAVMARGVTGFDTVIGKSSAIKHAKERALRLAHLEAPLLITGETGTGKDLFARACHASSDRQEKPFLKVNCAALTASEAESELFGRASGAFEEGIDEGKPGVFELADGGAVFLYEVAELSTHLQAKLLRFLEDGIVRRIGNDWGKAVDIRIISASKHDLRKLTEEGAFRDDLLYRLNILNITLPRLVDRLQDIPDLTAVFFRRASARLGRSEPKVQEKAVRALAKCEWPGNVRQLENTVFQTLSMLKEDEIVTEFALDGSVDVRAARSSVERQTWTDYDNAIAAFERQLFSTLYKTYGSSRSLAKRLGLSHTTVARKLKKYGIGR